MPACCTVMPNEQPTERPVVRASSCLMAPAGRQTGRRLTRPPCCRAKDLIQKLLLVDPAQRLSADQALAHPWVALHDQVASPAGDLTSALDNLRHFRQHS